MAWWEAGTRILLAILIGLAIGYERERRNKPAGTRTHILVCLGAALIAVMENYVEARVLAINTDRDQTYADLNKVLRIEITEDSPAVEIYNEDGKAGEWDFQNLNRVTESDRIFELCRGGGRSRQYLALPKDALREGTVEEFRSCMDRWLKGDKTVEYYDISERRQKQLMKAKYQLFKH